MRQRPSSARAFARWSRPRAYRRRCAGAPRNSGNSVNHGGSGMGRVGVRVGLTAALLAALAAAPALAQQSGGVLRIFHRDSPASMSIHEEATISTVGPMMAVFNNLVLFNQHEKQNRPEFIEPELAESWSWNEDGTRLTFKLRRGVKWHDGKPFTAADVKCTWDMLSGKSANKLRLNPRKAWYRNLDDVTTRSEE